MDKITRRIEEIKNYGYELDFSDAFNPAFSIYKKIVGSAGVMMLLIVLVIFAIAFIGIFTAVGLNGFTQNMQNFSPVNLSLTFFLLYCVLVFAGAMVSVLLTAGFLQMAYNAYHDTEFTMGTVFEHFNGRYTRELVIAATIITVPNLIQILTFEYFRFVFMGSIVSLIIGFITFLTVPLIIFGQLKAVEAVSGSIAVIIKNILMIFLLLIVSYLLALSGMIACGIGIVFTIPFMYAMQMSLYLNIFDHPEMQKEIDSNATQNFV